MLGLNTYIVVDTSAYTLLIMCHLPRTLICGSIVYTAFNLIQTPRKVGLVGAC